MISMFEIEKDPYVNITKNKKQKNEKHPCANIPLDMIIKMYMHKCNLNGKMNEKIKNNND